MAVYYKFKSAKDYDSIPIDGHFISVGALKERIVESKHLGRGTDYDIEVTNAQTNEAYLEEAVILKNTSVLIRRIPGRSGRPHMPIVNQPEESNVESKPEEDFPIKTTFTLGDVSSVRDLEPPEWEDEFGLELYAPIPDVAPVQISNMIQDDTAPSKADEDSKIKALIETPALDWQRQAAEGFGAGRGFGRGGRGMMGGRGFGRAGPAGKPPPGYVCHRCKVPGHFIQHCPTNGDPNFDLKKVKPPTGIPKSMLMFNPDGSYGLPSGAAAEMKPNEAAFEKEIEGLPSTRPVGDLPPELHCPLCKEVMKDAVLTSKCCFQSFCDKCIRDYIMSKSVCVCGFRDILADDLLPNKTVRDTINRILESTNSSGDNAGSAFQVQDMESARCPQPKMASPTQSAASKGEHVPPTSIKETPKPDETANEETSAGPSQPVIQQTSDKLKTLKVPDISEATLESGSAREPAPQCNALQVEEEVQQKLAAAEAKKKKKKKPRLPVNAMDIQWRNPQDFAADNYMMPMGPSTYNPYWTGMQPGMHPGMQHGMDGYMGSFGGGMPYTMGYGVGPMDMPFMGVGPNDPFMAQNLMFPMMPPQRDLADFGMGFNARPPLMTREEFEARKADLRRKREMERMGEREMPKGRDLGREVSSSVNAMPPMKLKPKPPVPSHREPSEDRFDRERDRDRDRDRHRDNDYDNHNNTHRGGSSSNSRSHRLDRSSPGPTRSDIDHLPRPSSKRKTDHPHQPDRDRDHHRHRRTDSSSKPTEEAQKSSSSSAAAAAAAAAERKHKASVFSRISFPEGGEEPNKKRRLSSEPKPSTKDAATPANGSVSAAASSSKVRSSQMDYESSDDDRHFKRKPSRYEPSPPPPRQEEGRRSRGSKDRERERERDSGARSSRHR